MGLHKLTAYQLKNKIDKKEIKVEEVIRAYLDKIEKKEGEIGAFLYAAKEEALCKAKKLDFEIGKGRKLKALGGIPLGIKDNICVRGMQNTCGSQILKGYISPFDAHVVEKIKEEDGIIIGKLNMDEFAMGSSNENSSFNTVKNPWNLKKVPGGSSGGSAAAVAACEVPLSLGTETGGSVRQPASLCGVVGLKPTYGRISRYGVVAFASTLDTVGIMGRDVEDCAMLTEAIAGVDTKDSTTVNIKVPQYKRSLTKDLAGKRIGIPKEFFGVGLDEGVRKKVEEALKVLKENGAQLFECSLPLTEYALPTYHIIASAEASSNLARFDGISYGERAKGMEEILELYFKSRTEGFGKEVKRRMILGTYVLSSGQYDAYYKKAMKVRSLIQSDFQRVLKEFDAVVSPTTPSVAFNLGEKTKDPLSMYLSDVYTVPANLAGIPAISVPCGRIDGLPVGLQIMGNYFREDLLFNLAYSYEQSTDWHKIIAGL